MFKHEDEVIDDLQRDGLRILQKQDGFKFGIDAVLLSHFVEARPGAVIYDLGTGTGIIPMLLSSLVPAERIVGVEIQHEMAEMAGRTVRMNDLEDRIEILEVDVHDCAEVLGRATADVVVSNPPYFKANSALKNPHDGKAIARHEIRLTLETLVASAAALLKPGGHLFMIHRPHRLVDLIHALRTHQLEPKVIRFISPRRDKAPNLFLIRATRGGRPELRFLDPLSIYNDDGSYTREVLSIYQEASIDINEKEEGR